jgi:anaerobic magnesium-protoporphyrin IX monomethyl ester cyclase
MRVGCSRMRVLLVNPDISLVRAPNLPLGYLAAALEAAGHEVRLADIAFKGWDRDRVTRVATGEAWDLVGIQVYSCGWEAAKSLAQAIKARRPSARVVVGGRHASALPEEVLAEEPAVDFVLASESERSLPALAAALADGADGIADVPELYRRDGAGVVRGPCAVPTPLDDLPLPAWHHIAPSLYPAAPQGGFVKALPIAPLITSRGCPYRCRFCASGVGTSGRAVRYRSPGAVADEAALLVRDHGIRELQILDDNFTLKRAHAEGVCEALLSRGLGLALSLPNGVRLDKLDAELVRLLERTGCYSLTVGVDSGSQRVLDSMDRQVTLEGMRTGIRLIKEHSRIRVTGNFILGLPGETLADIGRTIRYARTVGLDRAYFAVYLPLPGSPLFDELRAAGALEGMRYDHLTPAARAIPFTPEGVSEKQLRRALWRAYAEFYLRPSILWHLAREVRSVEHARFLAGKVAGRLVGRETEG